MVDYNAVLDDRGSRGSRIDAFVAKVLQQRLAGTGHGKLELTLPSGLRVDLGPGGGVEARLRIKSYRIAARALARGMIGFADSYMAEEIDTPDLKAVMEFFLANFEAFDTAGGGWFRTRLFDRIGHRRRANTRRGSRRNIAAHYDLGNAFYELWLDSTMNYSSGVYENAGDSLETAQERKLALVLDALGVGAGAKVLEIGCGWGCVAERLAKRDIDVTAVTVSEEQFAYARDRLQAAGLASRADIRFQDYRDVTGTFDGIVSVEMIEAVGEENWPVYFRQLSDRLRPGGAAVIQAITINEASFESYRRHPDFIQRYIFPGGMLPTVAAMEREAASAGLAMETVAEFGESYAATLREWRHRFLAQWPKIAALGFDERFRRMWLYYLIYCEVGFETGLIDVGVYRFRRPGV